MAQIRPPQKEPTILQVGQLNRVAAGMLDGLDDVWVAGELADVTRHASGHVYFTLNDPREPAQIRGVMFQSDARRSKAKLEKGAVVRLRGSVSIYVERGQYQIVARTAIEAGAGTLAAQFERTRQKLAKEGLLAPERKRKLPRFPRVVGVVTSAHGAAMHDIVRVAKGRFPVRIVVADCRVQGEGAPRSIVEALVRIQRVPGLDVVIIARGGGSAEDLWAFNHEAVARTVAECRVPTIAGVGHEVDVTITDLVADARASTPSNAAELALPERRAVETLLTGFERRLQQAMHRALDRRKLRLGSVRDELADPRFLLRPLRDRLVREAHRLDDAMAESIARDRARLRALDARLGPHNPRARLKERRRAIDALERRLVVAMSPHLEERRRAIVAHVHATERLLRAILARKRNVLERSVHRADALSPLKVLSRGYSITLSNGRALVRAADASVGARVRILLRDGELEADVVEILE
jgi:exodeoxyribonuclease VII large subunit